VENLTQEKKIIFSITLLYILSLFISKFGISLFGGILAIYSIYYFFKNDKPEDFILPFFILILGLILQCFSLGGFKSFIIFSYKNYFLLILPLVPILLKDIKENYIVNTVASSLFIGILKSFYNFYKDYNLQYSSSIRVDSFFDIMRWGIILVMGLLIILPYLNKKRIFLWIVFFLGIISLALNNSRGPILSLILGIIIFIILKKKIKLGIGIIVVLISAFFILKSTNILNQFSDRMESINNTKSGGNAARIFMWKKGMSFMTNSLKENKKIFFFGTGINNRKKIFEKYLIENTDYKELNDDVKVGVSFDDSHNAYINMFIQTGFIFTIIYYIMLLYYTIMVFINYFKYKHSSTLSSFLAVIAFYFCGIFYGYSFTYETFTFFFILGIGLIKNDLSDERG
jgi:putative O antigen ligase